MIIMRVYRFEVNMTPVREFQDKSSDTTASVLARRTVESHSRSTRLARVSVRPGDWGVFLQKYYNSLIFGRNIILKFFSKSWLPGG